MIAIVIRELTYLKVLAPIMNEILDQGGIYNIYYYDAPRGEKEYNRASLSNIKLAVDNKILQGAHMMKAFTSDAHLFSLLESDKITKLVSIEVGLWANKYMKRLNDHNIKVYSVLWLTDSMWHSKPTNQGMFRVYYAAKHIMNMCNKFFSTSFDPKRDRCFGSPLFDPLINIKNEQAKSVLILMPNQCSEKFFGGIDRFVKIIEAFGPYVIFKTRKKQWMPSEIKNMNKEIVYDGSIMYPPAITQLFPRTKAAAMFYSSGIYEAICAGQYVINVKFPLSFWPREKDRMNEYFSGEIYNFDGVINSFDQDDILNGKLEIKSIDRPRRDQWISKYIGSANNSAKYIAEDILNS